MALSNPEIFSIIVAVFGVIFILIGLGMLYLCSLFLRGKIKRNRSAGFRIKEAFESEEAWLRINREGAKLLIGPSLGFIACGLLMIFYRNGSPALVEVISAVLLACAVLTAVLAAAYVWKVKRNAT
jgi:hypothetical protein